MDHLVGKTPCRRYVPAGVGQVTSAFSSSGSPSGRGLPGTIAVSWGLTQAPSMPCVESPAALADRRPQSTAAINFGFWAIQSTQPAVNLVMNQLSANYDRFRMSARDLVEQSFQARNERLERGRVNTVQSSPNLKDGLQDATLKSNKKESMTSAGKTDYGTIDGDNEELLIAVGNSQDRRAFNMLFQRFGGKIYALGMKITRNEQLANDLVQEAMLIIWQKAPLYDLDKGSAQTWIFTLVRNRCFDILRKMKRQPEGISADDVFAETEQQLSVDPEQQQTNEIQLEQIGQHFSRLPAAQQQVIEYVFMKDLTHQEAAKQLDIPLGTLKSRLRLALNKLRDYIGVEE